MVVLDNKPPAELELLLKHFPIFPELFTVVLPLDKLENVRLLNP